MKDRSNKTGKYIESIIVNSNTSLKTLDDLKKQRETQVVSQDEQSKVTDNRTLSSKLDEKPAIMDVSSTEPKALTDFNKMLDSEFYKDKKEPFLMSLSGDCLQDYENIALGMSFKTKKRIGRNDIIRKVLEHYMNKRKNELQAIILEL